KDPWNRYQRGKDMALALYQLKAHLEEQKALQDLGTMVSAAENLPTLKLANLQELAAQGAPGAQRDTTIVPPPAISSTAETPAARPLPPSLSALDESQDHELTTAAPDLGVDTIPPARMPSDEMPPLPPPTTAASPAPAPASQDWKKVAKREVNPQWFW